MEKIASRAIDDRDHACWRFELTLYPRLRVYRSLFHERGLICWWKLSKVLPYLKKPCISMVKLVCGNSVLAEFKNVELDRSLQLCPMCFWRS